MKIGFTGTSKGMNDLQKRNFVEFIDRIPITEFHHGDCIGADVQAHNIIQERCDAKIIVHPPSNPKKRAYAKCPDFVCGSKGYIKRNHDIVDVCDYLIACPKGKEILRSGTWATIRYAKKLGKSFIIFHQKGGTNQWKLKQTSK